VIVPYTDQHWGRWAAVLQHKIASRSQSQLVIPMNPAYAPLRFDAGRWLPEVDILAETVVASLGTHGTFRQSFVSRCDDLSAVQMRLGAAAPSKQGALTVSLVEGPRENVVATTTVPRADMVLDGDWEFFWFHPVWGSAGKRYTIVLGAVENDLAASLFVLGSREDKYPEGDAVFIGQQLPNDASFRYFMGQPLPGDASFRYGCQEPPTAP